MKEIKYVYVGKAKDLNFYNITIQTIRKYLRSENNENKLLQRTKKEI